MPLRKGRLPPAVTGLLGVTLGLAVGWLHVVVLMRALAERTEHLDRATIGLVLATALLAYGLVDLRTAFGSRGPSGVGAWVRPGAKLTMVVGLIPYVVAVGAGSYDERIVRREGSGMVRSLRTLAALQDSHYAAMGTYAPDLAALDTLRNRELVYRRLVVSGVDGTGWSATAYSDLVTRTCSISVRRQGQKARTMGPRCTRECSYKTRGLGAC